MLCTHIFVCMHQLFLLFLLQMIFILFINKNYFIYKAYQKIMIMSLKVYYLHKQKRVRI